MSFPLKNPTPDFQEFEKVLKGKKRLQKVHFVEASVDREVMEYIIEKMVNEKLFYLKAEEIRREKLIRFREEGKSIALLTEEEERAYYKQFINF